MYQYPRMTLQTNAWWSVVFANVFQYNFYFAYYIKISSHLIVVVVGYVSIWDQIDQVIVRLCVAYQASMIFWRVLCRSKVAII